jgi:hypothetical protein
MDYAFGQLICDIDPQDLRKASFPMIRSPILREKQLWFPTKV